MQKRFSDIKKASLFTADGTVGRVSDILLDDERWIIRYFVIDIQHTLPTRKILLAPAAIQRFESRANLLITVLGSNQIMASPPLEADQPVSREYEQELVAHFGWPIYWLGRAAQFSPQTLKKLANVPCAGETDEQDQPKLRSAAEICGYRIKTADGLAGFVNDLMVATDSWTVDFAEAEASSWLSTQSSLFSTTHITSIDWENRELVVDLTQPIVQTPFGNPHSRPGITGEPLSSQPFRTL